MSSETFSVSASMSAKILGLIAYAKTVKRSPLEVDINQGFISGNLSIRITMNYERWHVSLSMRSNKNRIRHLSEINDAQLSRMVGTALCALSYVGEGEVDRHKVGVYAIHFTKAATAIELAEQERNLSVIQ